MFDKKFAGCHGNVKMIDTTDILKFLQRRKEQQLEVSAP